MTEQRKALISCLLTAKKPLTVHEAYEAVNKNKRHQVADLASFYRIFEALEGIEIIHKTGQNSYVLCQHMSCDEDNHLLLRCHNCDGFIEMHMPEADFKQFAGFLQKNKKFRIDRHPLNLSGLCANCQ